MGETAGVKVNRLFKSSINFIHKIQHLSPITFEDSVMGGTRGLNVILSENRSVASSWLKVTAKNLFPVSTMKRRREIPRCDPYRYFKVVGFRSE